MPRGLGSPRARPGTLGDLGERSAFIARQRVGGAGHRRLGRLVRGAGWALAAALAVLAAGGTAHWLLTSPRFAVVAVEVRGASRTDPAAVVEAAAIPLGASLFTVDPQAVARRVTALPGVRRADVVRALPNRVHIVIEERRPFTLVHDGRLHWLDEEGHLLGDSPEAVAPPVPVISGLDAAELAAGRAAPGPKTRTAIAVIRALLRAGGDLAGAISEIDMSPRDGPVLYTVDGVEVRLGLEEWEERLARLEAVLGQVATDDVRAVDLRFRDRVVLRREEPR